VKSDDRNACGDEEQVSQQHDHHRTPSDLRRCTTAGPLQNPSLNPPSGRL